ncbi:MAG: hypothetical protein DWQ19_11745 [Crenarchaeota archaeon]|uniref:Uncharacterized protein n=1 Tax=Thermoproteota archaeon TaxID=2056631 RepID=A0ACD6BAH6_9CREN|nr:MAG: hypothetical protein DWQ19_11745 [Thermoproteota archaeon]
MDNDITILAVDWSHEERKLAIFDGKKIRKKLPEPSSDVIIVAENIPQKYAAPFIEVGAKVLRCSTNATADARKNYQKKVDAAFAKNDENDSKVIWALYQTHPELFREMKLEPPLSSYYAIFKDYQEVRIRTGNRLYSDRTDAMEEFFKIVKKGEHELKKAVDKELENHPVYTQWLQHIKGIGPVVAGGLISLIGDIDRFDSVSKLWAYAGYSVDNGKVQKRKKGVASNWKNKIRTHCYNIVDSFIKQRTSVYRELYDAEKARQRPKVESDGHAHNRAVRKVAKVFLQHYWVVSRELAGFSVSKPWILEHGGHVDYIKPPHWNKVEIKPCKP